MRHSFLIFFYTVIVLFSNSLFSQDIGGTGVTGGYKLVWQDTFSGTQLDEAKSWKIEVNGNGGGNNELQYYRRENISMGNEPISGVNCLIITGKKESYLGKTCTSGRLTTQNKMSFTYGKLEARIKLPKTANGLWPAFWMLGSDINTESWPACGEVDILEMGNANGITNGTQDKLFNGACHWGYYENGWYPNYAKATVSTTGLQDDFHLFTMVWDTKSIKMYLDWDKNPTALPYYEMGITSSVTDKDPAYYFHKQYFVLFNLAIGGNFPNIKDITKITALNNGDVKMYVDYVKMYQKGDVGQEYEGPALTAVNKLSVPNNFRIYPNPTTDKLRIEGNGVPTQITLINITGQEILKISNSTSLDVSHLPAGNYLLKIKGVDGKIETHQLTKK